MPQEPVHINAKGKKQNSFDAIVIGSGISGGWAAKELCEKGLKTLVLERGRNIEHIKDYPTATLGPWEFKHRGQMTKQFLEENPLITKTAGYGEDTAHFFIKDKDHPYVQEKPFNWVRGYQVGGKSLTWGRACQRWSDFEFTAPGRYGYGEGFPIRYKDVASWYSHVEKFIGVCGKADGIESMPDGEYLPPFDFNAAEASIHKKISAHYSDRHMVHARWAHLTEPKEIHIQQGRSKCQARNRCMRGCPFGGYFSSVSSTLPWAKKTGNLTIRPFSVAHSIIYDEQKQRATGIRVVDAQTKKITDYFATIIFVNGSSLNSNLVLLNSTSRRFPNGLGNDNGLLGTHVAFHNYRAGVGGTMEGMQDKYYYGRNPTEPIIANYRNLHKQDTDYVGGFTTFMGAHRSRRDGEELAQTIGGAYKDAMTEPGEWNVYMYMQGETIMKRSNHVRLSTDQKDEWGVPLLITSVDYDDNDEKMIPDFINQSLEMLEVAGCKNLTQYDNHQAPGLDIHEMGGCKMGSDPKTSLLNEWNQLHHCKNVFVTDGACMASTGNQSPSLLYMALTARAVTHAVEEIRKKNLKS